MYDASSESKVKQLNELFLSVCQSVDNIPISPYPFERFIYNFVYSFTMPEVKNGGNQ
jgi:hypothetical protein